MLTLNPAKWPNAWECLKHPFFEPPKVYKPPQKKIIPKIDFSESAEEKKRREDEKKKEEEEKEKGGDNKKKTYADELSIIP